MNSLKDKVFKIVNLNKGEKDFYAVKLSDAKEYAEEARADENKRNIEIFMSLPATEFTDLKIKGILERRNEKIRSIK